MRWLFVMIVALGWAGCAGFSAPKYGAPRGRATADYVKGEERFTLEEWAAILTKTERENFHREIY